jgi:hypothetical protein
VKTECKLLAYTVLFTGIYCGLFRDYYTSHCMGTSFIVLGTFFSVLGMYYYMFIVLGTVGTSYCL